MLLTKMDLLNYQYLDKMNNNIGILCYEGKVKALLLRLFLKASKRPRPPRCESTLATPSVEVFTQLTYANVSCDSAQTMQRKVVCFF